MKKLALFIVFVLFGGILKSQNHSQGIKGLFFQGDYQACFDQCEAVLYNPSTKKDPTAHLYTSLCYYKFSRDNIKSEEYPSALKKSVKHLKISRKKDKSGQVFAQNDSLVKILSWVYRQEINFLHQQNRSVLETYFIKNFTSIFGYDPSGPKPNTDQGKNPGGEPKNNPKPPSPKTGGKKPNDKLISYAKTKIGTPYVYGGTTNRGFDCSGYTGHVFAKYGYELPRVSRDQAREGVKVKTRTAQKGDLVFFGKGSKVSHVGIIISDPGEPLAMIHCSSSKGVSVIRSLQKNSYWAPRMLFIRRVI